MFSNTREQTWRNPSSGWEWAGELDMTPAGGTIITRITTLRAAWPHIPDKMFILMLNTANNLVLFQWLRLAPRLLRSHRLLTIIAIVTIRINPQFIHKNPSTSCFRDTDISASCQNYKASEIDAGFGKSDGLHFLGSWSQLWWMSVSDVPIIIISDMTWTIWSFFNDQIDVTAPFSFVTQLNL